MHLNNLQVTEVTNTMASFETTTSRFKPVDYLWLGVALLVHTMLLLIPFNMPDELDPIPANITVTFANPPKAVSQEDQPIEPQVAAQQPDITPEKKPDSIIPEPMEPQVSEPLPATTQTVPKTVSAAQLLHSAAEFSLSVPEKEKPLTLGAFKAPPLPANWSSSITMEENLFDGTVALTSPEVMDEWVDVSGGYNMVVKTQSGRTLCGRAQAWNSMNPLQEHVMMWGPCGGNGKRKAKPRHQN